jgi:hypothetical protein
MRIDKRLLLTAGMALLFGVGAGCIEPFEGSHVQFTLADVPPPCQVLLLADLACDPTAQQPDATHTWTCVVQNDRYVCTTDATGINEEQTKGWSCEEDGNGNTICEQPSKACELINLPDIDVAKCKYAADDPTKGAWTTDADGKCTRAGAKKDAWMALEDSRFVYHYEMWATVNKSAAVYLFSFTVQPHLFPCEEKELDEAGVKLASGKTFKIGGQSEITYDQMSDAEKSITDTQLAKAGGVNVITSFSHDKYENDDPGTNKLAPHFYLGNHRQLSLAVNGTYYGQINSSHPYASVTLGGATATVEPNLENLDSMWITIEFKPPDRPDPTPGKLVYLRGTAYEVTRGVINVEATSPYSSDAQAAFGVIPSQGEEGYF